MFTTDDYEKFRELRVTHLAARFEALVTDEANDDLTVLVKSNETFLA